MNLQRLEMIKLLKNKCKKKKLLLYNKLKIKS